MDQNAEPNGHKYPSAIKTNPTAPVQPKLREMALIESITTAHEQFVAEIMDVPYCQLTTRLGMLKMPELTYVEEHGCPVCGKKPFQRGVRV